MIRQIGIIIGIGALVVTAAPTTEAVQKRAGRSLDHLENRSNAKDAEVFFPEISQTAPDYPERTISTRQSGSIVPYIGDEVQIQIGETGNSVRIFDSFSGSNRGDTSDKVQVLFEIGEWNN